MTTKSLLDDVNILKKDRHKSESTWTRKRDREGIDDGLMTGQQYEVSAMADCTDRRESTASSRLSYSSTSSSNTSHYSSADPGENDDVRSQHDELLPSEREAPVKSCDAMLEVITKEEGKVVNMLVRGKDSLSDNQTSLSNQVDGCFSKNRKIDRIEITLLVPRDKITCSEKMARSGDILFGNERETLQRAKEESPLNTSLESEFTPSSASNISSNTSSDNNHSLQSRATRSSSRSNT